MRAAISIIAALLLAAACQESADYECDEGQCEVGILKIDSLSLTNTTIDDIQLHWTLPSGLKEEDVVVAFATLVNSVVADEVEEVFVPLSETANGYAISRPDLFPYKVSEGQGSIEFELRVQLLDCRDKPCATFATTYRSFALLLRPRKNVEVTLVGGSNGEPRSYAIEELQLFAAGCEHALVTMGDSLREAQYPYYAEEFLENAHLQQASYDCAIGVAYADKDTAGVLGTPDDTIYYCQSMTAGVESFADAVTALPETLSWDAFGYSKGAAIMSEFFASRSAQLPDGTSFYGVGIPQERGIEHWPNYADSYRFDEINVTTGQGDTRFVGITWGDDPVRFFDACLDISASIDLISRLQDHSYREFLTIAGGDFLHALAGPVDLGG